MNEERELILKMLEEGKITAEEAAQLLEAIEGEEFYYEEEYYEEESKLENEGKKQKEETFSKIKKLQELPSKIQEKVTEAASSIGEISKLEELPHTIEKEINEAVSTIKEKEKDISTFERTIDRLLDNFLGISLGKTVEKEFKCEGIEDNTTVKIEGKNGKIYIETWGKDYASIIARYVVSRNGEEEIILNCQKGLLEIKRTPKIKALSVKVYLPKVKYKDINLSTTNGKISIQGLEGDALYTHTTNGTIYLENVRFPQIENYTTNARIEIEKALCEKLVSRTTNGTIAVEDISFNKAQLSTINGKVIVESFRVNSSNSSLKASTTNGNIEMKLAEKKIGVSFDLKTINGTCHVELPNLLYEVKGGSYIRGNTKDYEKTEKNISIIAHTINGNVNLE
ncbi:MAG TPA: DUF4097 family beta strand repeat protein [Clostridia bacterium]|nr:DUF4097 family beta strand repeat protein [Clostridia bacterium]